MELTPNDLAKIQRLMREITLESKKERQRRHRIANLSSQVLTVLRKAERKNKQ